MKQSFFGRPVPFFGTRAMLIMCAIFFLLPFTLRGARMAVESMKNDVTDWLPKDYQETRELDEFRKWFVGDQFVVITWPGCRKGDPKYDLFLSKLRRESLEFDHKLTVEERRAHEYGDRLGLHNTTNKYHEDWGEYGEKWLLGHEGWYFITTDGSLYKWDGENNVVQGLSRAANSFFNGDNGAKGRFITQFKSNEKHYDENGHEVNPFYADPSKLFARFFKSVTSGPEVFEKMTGEEGTLRIGDYSEQDNVTFNAKKEAHKRLTGVLFGPTPKPSFKWTFDSLLDLLKSDFPEKLELLDDSHRIEFESFVRKLVDSKYGSDLNALVNAPRNHQLEHWYDVWDTMGVDPPHRQSCIIVNLNQPVLNDLARAIGRPLMGKPRGRILWLASKHCGIKKENLHIGGPPVDNVAIDEEGSITLLKLVSLSMFIGIGLAYVCFRSVRATMMLFFVGGVAAMTSLAFVWFADSTLDAILMSMPSLVYVLGLSGAVHIVNYYRDAARETGKETAVDMAVKHGWFPCTLAAFTTSLGLISLYTSYLTPIKKFGLYSSIATMATVILLFSYLPAALYIWPAFARKKMRGGVDEPPDESKFALAVGNFWSGIGEWVIRHYRLVIVTASIMLVVFSYGISQVQTSVHLLKLFDPNAKILQDYRWMEENLGKLVPMEVVLEVKKEHQQVKLLQATTIANLASQTSFTLTTGSDVDNTYKSCQVVVVDGETLTQKAVGRISAYTGSTKTVTLRDDPAVFTMAATDTVYIIAPDEPELLPPATKEDEAQKARVLAAVGNELQLNFLERSELSQRVRVALERVYGPEGLDIVGAGTSTDVFLPLFYVKGQVAGFVRDDTNNSLSRQREIIGRDTDYFRIDPSNGTERWRISLRLAALNDVDYGKFVGNLKTVVEPILSAYRHRTAVLREIQEITKSKQASGAGNPDSLLIMIVGRDPRTIPKFVTKVTEQNEFGEIDQTLIFADTMRDLLENRGFEEIKSSKPPTRGYLWVSQERYEKTPADKWKAAVDQFDAVIKLEDLPNTEILEIAADKKKPLFDVSDHHFVLDRKSNEPQSGQRTALDRKIAGEENAIVSASYTGIIPIVYKAQRALLQSLINSIALAFIMIAIVMMLLLRNWREKVRLTNCLNIRGGMTSMMPNIFPVVIIFGAMGLMKIKVDIGSMMTASVAMGVAVDDTIHFLTWYRAALFQGKSRHDAIRESYRKVATAMTQTTLIGGFGLSAFAFSTFTPTQKFGVLMLFLLAAALVGDLILLPAILASPLGKWFGKSNAEKKAQRGGVDFQQGQPVPISSQPDFEIAEGSAQDATIVRTDGSNSDGPQSHLGKIKRREKESDSAPGASSFLKGRIPEG